MTRKRKLNAIIVNDVLYQFDETFIEDNKTIEKLLEHGSLSVNGHSMQGHKVGKVEVPQYGIITIEKGRNALSSLRGFEEIPEPIER